MRLEKKEKHHADYCLKSRKEKNIKGKTDAEKKKRGGENPTKRGENRNKFQVQTRPKHQTACAGGEP